MAAHRKDADRFHEAIQYSLRKLGKPATFVLKEQQYEILKAVAIEKKDVLAVLPTGYGKSLVYQSLGFICDFMRHGECCDHSSFRLSLVIVISPLNSLMDDQVEKLKRHMKVLVLKNTEHALSLPESGVNIVFAHPEVFVESKVKIFRDKKFQSRVCAVVVDEAHLVEDWKEFRPAYGKLGLLGNYFPAVPIVALTATATQKSQTLICSSLGLFNPLIIAINPDRPNIYFASCKRKARSDGTDDKLSKILDPLVLQLKNERQDFPLTLIYGNLETISECYMYFSQSLGREQYEPVSAAPVAKNRLFTQYHAQYPDSERKRIVSELANNKSKLRILFVTVAFGIGVDINNIRQIIHIGVPYTMEEYFQEAGHCGRDGLPAKVTIYFNSYDISAARSQLTDVMCNYVTQKKCKRKAILNYFGFPLPKRNLLLHTCCDSCKAMCACDDCIVDAVADVDLSCLATNVDTTLNITHEEVTEKGLEKDKAKALSDRLHAYRFSLYGTGRSCVGGVSLATGFSRELIDSIVVNANSITSVEDIITGYPVFSADHAKSIFDILQEVL